MQLLDYNFPTPLQPSNIVFLEGNETEFIVIDWAEIKLIKGTGAGDDGTRSCEDLTPGGYRVCTYTFMPGSSHPVDQAFRFTPMSDW